MKFFDTFVYRAFLSLLVLFAVWNVDDLVQARDCPSLLPGHLKDIGDSFQLGAEVRTFYLGVNADEGIPAYNGMDSEWQNNYAAALRIQANWYILDELTAVLEAEMRYKHPGWEYKKVPGLDLIRVTQALLDYDTGTFEATGGIQTLNFGTGAVLDQRFVSLYTQYKNKMFTVSAFGGAVQRDMMKSALNCMWMRYSSDNTGWKFISPTMKNFVAGLTFRWKTLRPYNIEALYLFSFPSMEHLRSHAFSILASGPIVPRMMSFIVEPALLLDNDYNALPAIVSEFRFAMTKPMIPKIKAGAALSFLVDHKTRFASVYENLSWGLLRRYSLYNGNIYFGKVSWQPMEYIKLFAHYFFQTLDYSSENTSDEMDLGVLLSYGDHYWIKLAYVGMNLAAPDLPASSGVYAELRIIFGDQF